MKFEFKIGAEFRIDNGKLYKCVKENNPSRKCSEYCAFGHTLLCARMECIADNRVDSTDVYFEEVES